LTYAVKLHFDRLSDEWVKSPEDPEILQRFIDSASLLQNLPLEINLWKSQNVYDRLHAATLPEMRRRPDEKSKKWLDKFNTLGGYLGFHVEKN
jgi:hypothetical protein